MLKRKDLGDERDPNPDKDQQYAQPELTEERIPGRSFGGENIAADQRRQAAERNAGPADRGNRSDDVQASDRAADTAATEGDIGDADRAHRANAARTQLDAERRSEADQSL